MMPRAQAVTGGLLLAGCLAASCTTLVSKPASSAAPPKSLPATSTVTRDTSQSRAYASYDFEPELIAMSLPEYPAAAMAANEQGTVLCSVYVDATGQVIEARVREGVSPALDAAALHAARTAEFKPALRKDGSTVAVWMVIPVEFKLH